MHSILCQVFEAKYQDTVYGVPPYKPVASLPNQYDDGSVLRNLAISIMQFWQHCYGADGSGGAVAAVSSTAQRVLHQLSSVPLEQHVSPAGWCEGLFKGQKELSSSLSVSTFLERQQVGRGGAADAGWGWDGVRHRQGGLSKTVAHAHVSWATLLFKAAVGIPLLYALTSTQGSEESGQLAEAFSCFPDTYPSVHVLSTPFPSSMRPSVRQRSPLCLQPRLWRRMTRTQCTRLLPR